MPRQVAMSSEQGNLKPPMDASKRQEILFRKSAPIHGGGVFAERESL